MRSSKRLAGSVWGLTILAVGFLVFLNPGAIHALDALPFSYQGALTDDQGTALTGDFEITFSLWDDSTNGTMLWSETHPSVSVSNGLFNVRLGSVTPIPLNVLGSSDPTPRWLAAQVEQDPPLLPRTPLDATPHAATAQRMNGDFISAENLIAMIDPQTLDTVFVIRADGGVTKSVEEPVFLRIGEEDEPHIEGKVDLAGLDVNFANPTGLAGNSLRIRQTPEDGSIRLADESDDETVIRWELGCTPEVCTAGLYDSTGQLGVRLSERDWKMFLGDSACWDVRNGGDTAVHWTICEPTGDTTLKLDPSGLGISLGGPIEFATPKLFARLTDPNSGDTSECFQDYIAITGSIKSDMKDGARDTTFQILFDGTIKAGRALYDDFVGIGVPFAPNILSIQQNSFTDPIADAWTVYSSRRWKTNINTIENALDKVQKLRGVEYDTKAIGKHEIGLIAEEVGDVIPEVVAYEDNGVDAKSVDYARLVALLIEGMKEQQTQIRDQHDEIVSLKQRVQDLDREM